MNANDYRNLLATHLNDVRRTIGSRNMIFQQDNALKHHASVTTEWFKTQKINLFEWPALSSDIKPIENLWDIFSRGVYAEGKQ